MLGHRTPKRKIAFFDNTTSGNETSPINRDEFIVQETQLLNTIQSELVDLFTSAFLNKPIGLHIHRGAIEDMIGENTSLQAFIQKAYSKVTDLDLSLGQKQKCVQLPSLSIIPQLLEFLKNQLEMNGKWLIEKFNTLDFSHIFHGTLIPLNLNQYALPKDNRIYYAKDRLQRRYDSLARLFSMDTSISACSAVIIFEDEIILAANCSNEQRSTYLARMLEAKLSVIRNALHRASTESSLISDYSFYVQTIAELKQSGGSTLPDFILIQALYKMIYATRNTIPEDEIENENYFTESNKNTLLSSAKYTILVPQRNEAKRKKRFVMAVFNGEINDDPITFTAFPDSLDNYDIQHFHAEQLIAYYLQQVKRIDLNDECTPFVRIGITKLCCATCASLNQFKRVSVRGSSQVTYHNTANLFQDTFPQVFQSDTTSPLPKRRTHPPSSPWSPELLMAISANKARKLMTEGTFKQLTTLLENIESDTHNDLNTQFF